MPGRSEEGPFGAGSGRGSGADLRSERSRVTRQVLDDLYSDAYRELHRIAGAIRRSDRNATISTSTLVHETWMRLAQSGTIGVESQHHLKHVVAQAMRHFVIEAARRRRASKRGGGVPLVTLDDSIDLPLPSDPSLLALDEALDELARVNSRQAALIELRFFGGLEAAEAAGVLGVSESTALRDWRVAKAWLASQIHRKR